MNHSNSRFLGAFAKLPTATNGFVISSPPSVHTSTRMQRISSHHTEFHGIRYLKIFLKSFDKIQDSLKSEKINDNLYEYLCTYMIKFRSVLLSMRNISGKICIENQNTSFLFNMFFFENLAVFEIMWKNLVHSDRP